MLGNAVPQRASKVSKCLQMLRDQDEFQLEDIEESDVMEKPWTLSFEPPSESPYHPQTMKVKLSFPSRFPFEPPSVTFVTSIYHPNIDTAGTICLDLLKPIPAGSWKPSIDIVTLMTAIKLLLAEPNPDDPLMPDIASEYRENPELYRQRARQLSMNGKIDGPNEEEANEATVKAPKKFLLKRKVKADVEDIIVETLPTQQESIENGKENQASFPEQAIEKQDLESSFSNKAQEKTQSLESDDDEFEASSRTKPKRSLLSSKRAKTL